MIAHCGSLPSRVAIAGGGFCGALTLANLIAKGQAPLAIDLYESSGRFFTGVAYGTEESAYLLNVQAFRIGAYADEPAGFYAWLQSKNGQEAKEEICPNIKIAAEAYLPRRLYGRYLQQVVAREMEKAQAKGIAVQLHQAEVMDAEACNGRLKVQLREQNGLSEIMADALVLATGNLPPRMLISLDSERVVADIWNPAPSGFTAEVRKLPPSSEIVIIGTGLTMVDAVIMLRHHGYPGGITALSRRGFLPAAHAEAPSYPAWAWTQGQELPVTARAALRRLRREIRHAAAAGFDWRSVIDSLRPITPALWKELPFKEKRRFLTHLSSLWSVHRHRMAPEIASEIAMLRQTGRLRVWAGRITGMESEKNALRVTCRLRNGQTQPIHAAYVLNCTGPDMSIAGSRHALLQRLAARGLITAHALGTGVDEGQARDNAIFPMGNLLAAERLECTAVPELRLQAAEVAEAVLARIPRLRENTQPL